MSRARSGKYSPVSTSISGTIAGRLNLTKLAASPETHYSQIVEKHEDFFCGLGEIKGDIKLTPGAQGLILQSRTVSVSMRDKIKGHPGDLVQQSDCIGEKTNGMGSFSCGCEKEQTPTVHQFSKAQQSPQMGNLLYAYNEGHSITTEGSKFFSTLDAATRMFCKSKLTRPARTCAGLQRHPGGTYFSACLFAYHLPPKHS